MHHISQQEQALRKNAVDFARGSVRLEGVTLSQRMEALNLDFIVGRINNEVHTKLCLQAIDEEDVQSRMNSSPKG